MDNRRMCVGVVALACFLPLTAPAQIPPAPEAPLLELDLGPYVQYVTPSEAVVSWWTRDECPSILEYGRAGPGAKHSPSIQLQGPHQGKLEHRIEQQSLKKHHAVRIGGLRPNEVYAYRVTARQGDTTKSTPVFELDTALNYRVRPLPAGVRVSADEAHAEQVRRLAKEILRCSGAAQGYCLVWGVVDGVLAYELAAQSGLTVLGIDADAGRVARVRNNLYQAGVYGTRITLQHVPDLGHLPYPGSFANLIVSERLFGEGKCPGRAAEMYRVLRPRGSAAVLCGPSAESKQAAAAAEWLRADAIDSRKRETPAGTFHVTTKPVPAGIGSWTHQYGDAGNTADSHDELGGATGTDQLRVQWLGRPGADFGMDRNPRMPAPLAAHGRLFHQGMNRMVALDAYNGTILWSMEIPGLQRVNMPRDAGNWCTDDESLYVAVRDRCWVLDHNDGKLERVFDLPGGLSAQEYDWGYVARTGATLVGSAVKKNTSYTDFWGDDAWYDQRTGFGTEKVCSDVLFAYDLRTGKLLWTRREGLAINTTLALHEQRMYLVEARSTASKESRTRRLNDASFWSDQHLVCLDVRTGRPAYEAPLDTVDGIVAFYLCCREDTLVVVSSAGGFYHLYKFDPNSLALLWHVEHKWPSDNHGGHLQHPVVLADRVFLEPCGYDLATGRLLTAKMSGREGCATYCGTKHALVHRGQARCITLWDFTTGRITSWRNLRPSCWLSTVVGEGMVLSPEGGGGCSCGNWLETSLVFSPREDRMTLAAVTSDGAAGRSP